MEKKEANKEPFNRPDGVEVKLTAKSINIRGFLFFFILFLIGSYLFVYVWDEPSSYSAGRLLGTAVKGISSPQVMLCIFLLLVFYILIQAGILYWFSGKDKKLLHWHFDWTGVGFSLTRPIPLKFYRVSLLLPGILWVCACNPWVLYRRSQHILFGIIWHSGWYGRFSFLVQPSCL